MAETAGSIKWDLDLDDAKFKQKLRGSADEVRGFGRSLESAKAGSQDLLAKITLLGVAGAAALGGLLTFGFLQTKEIQKQVAGIQALTKSSKEAGKVIKDMVDYVQGKPFDRLDAIGAAKQILGAGRAVKSLNSDMDLLGRMAILSGSDLSTMAEIFAKIAGEGRITGETFRQMNRALPITGQALVKKLGVPLDQVHEKMADGAVSFDIFRAAMDESLSPKLIEKAGNTIEQRLSSLSSSFRNLAFEALGVDFSLIEEGGMPLVKKGGLLDKMIGGINTLIEILRSPAVTEAFKKIGQGIVTGFTFITDNADKIFGFFKTLFNWIKNNGLVVAGIIVGALVPAFYAIAASFVAMYGPLIPFLAVGAALGFVIQKLVAHFGGLDAVLKTVGDAFKWMRGIMEGDVTSADLADGAFKDLIKTFEIIHSVFKKHIIPSLKELWSTIKKELFPALSELWELVEPYLLPTLKVLGIILGATLIGAIYLFINALRIVISVVAFAIKIYTKLATQSKQSWEIITNAIKGFIAFFASLPEKVGNIISAVIDWFANFPENIGIALGTAIRKIFEFADRTNKFFTEDIPAAGKVAVAWFQSLPDKIGTALSNMWKAVVVWFDKTIKSSQDSGKKARDGFLNFFKTLPDKIATIFTDVLDEIISWGPKLLKGGKGVADDFWKGFKKGLGISSPSFIEKAFINIAEQSNKTLGQLSGDISKFNSLGFSMSPTITAPTANIGTTTTSKISSPVYNIHLDGIMARSRSDLRQIGEDIIGAVDEARRAKGKDAILG